MFLQGTIRREPWLQGNKLKRWEKNGKSLKGELREIQWSRGKKTNPKQNQQEMEILSCAPSCCKEQSGGVEDVEDKYESITVTANN